MVIRTQGINSLSVIKVSYHECMQYISKSMWQDTVSSLYSQSQCYCITLMFTIKENLYFERLKQWKITFLYVGLFGKVMKFTTLHPSLRTCTVHNSSKGALYTTSNGEIKKQFTWPIWPMTDGNMNGSLMW